MVCARHLRDTEVGELHVPVPRDEDVRRIDVAMDDRRRLTAVVDGAVRRREADEETRRNVDRRRVVELLADGLEHPTQPAERRSVDVLEHHDELLVVREEVIEPDDARMREPRVRRSLPSEHALHVRVVRVLGQEQLEDDQPLEAVRAFGLCQQDVARPAGRKLAHDSIAADALSRAFRLVHPRSGACAPRQAYRTGEPKRYCCVASA